jgi:tetratricopeptide (TPR) repeat protein
MRWFLTYSFLIIALSGWTQSSNFTEGNDHYEAGEYEDAIDKYSSVISEGYHSAELYYNLGNAYYRNGKLGKAIWAYESSLKIEPSHKDALFNLEFVNAQTVDHIDTQRRGFTHWLQGIAFSSRVNFWVIVSVICALFFSLSATIFIRSKKKRRRNLSLISSSLFGIGLIMSLLIGYQHKNFLTSRSNAIVIIKQVNVLVSPTEEGKISYKLTEGAKVELISEEKEWVQINLNGNHGWLQKIAVWEI